MSTEIVLSVENGSAQSVANVLESNGLETDGTVSDTGIVIPLDVERGDEAIKLDSGRVRIVQDALVHTIDGATISEVGDLVDR